MRIQPLAQHELNQLDDLINEELVPRLSAMVPLAHLEDPEEIQMEIEKGVSRLIFHLCALLKNDPSFLVNPDVAFLARHFNK